jgi:hypothetical protein
MQKKRKDRKIFCFVFFLCVTFFNSRIWGQDLIVINGIHIDSLVKNRGYAEMNLLKVKNKYFLIEALLNYEGDFNTSPTWQICTYQDSVKKETYDGRYREQRTSNELIALYLIEAVIRNNVFFNDYSTAISILDKDAIEYGYPGKYLYPYKEDLYLYCEDGRAFYKMLINQSHIKKVYKYYNKWFRNIKRLNTSFEDIPNDYKEPLKNTMYNWGGIPHNSKSH